MRRKSHPIVLREKVWYTGRYKRKGGIAVKHGKNPSLLIWVAAVAACLAAAGLVWLGLSMLTPTEGPSYLPTGNTAVTTVGTEVQAPTLPPTTTTTAPPEIGLSVTSHGDTTVTTAEPVTVFRGTSDPAHPLTLNGKAVERTADGAFAVECTLSPGNNRFTFAHKGKTVTYTVRYTFTVITAHAPSKNQRYQSGATVNVLVTARRGSTVTATFNGKTITLQPDEGLAQNGAAESATFVDYTGSFTLPSDNTTDLTLGKITFSATHSGVKNTASSGTIVCEKSKRSTVGEIVAFTAETFSGDTVDDDSRPTNNYLPAGTVDYVVGHSYYGDKEYLNLRCGRRVYVSKEGEDGEGPTPVSKSYIGTLPDKNRLSVAGVEAALRFTTLTFDTDWKAPFLLDLLPQTYKNPKKQEYSVEAVTCEYVEITFCYAAAVTGNVTFAADHPLFSRAQISQAGEHTVLRLYLKKKGAFYGWDAEYNEKGQLVFRFLHPAQVKTAKNAYGADLSGVTVLVDVGHGGNRSGALGLDKNHPESERNLYLAKLIEKELKSLGATVVLNRTGDTSISSDERCKQLKTLRPDLCIAVHHDSSTSSRPNGFGSLYSTLFSKEPARYIYEATVAAGLYNPNAGGNRNRLEWHYYFMARMTACPVVLTENGFMSSPTDHTGIISSDANHRKAKAITQGVVAYFLSIRSDTPFKPTQTTTTTTTTVKTTTTTAVTTTAATTTHTTLPSQATSRTTASSTSTTTGTNKDNE